MVNESGFSLARQPSNVSPSQSDTHSLSYSIAGSLFEPISMAASSSLEHAVMMSSVRNTARLTWIKELYIEPVINRMVSTADKFTTPDGGSFEHKMLITV